MFLNLCIPVLLIMHVCRKCYVYIRSSVYTSITVYVIYIYIYSLHVCMYTRLYVHTYSYIFVSVCACMHVCIYVLTYLCMYAGILVLVSRAYTCIYVHMPIYIYTYMYTCIYAYVCCPASTAVLRFHSICTNFDQVFQGILLCFTSFCDCFFRRKRQFNVQGPIFLFPVCDFFLCKVLQGSSQRTLKLFPSVGQHFGASSPASTLW